jgi:hypothetical protein
MLYLIYQKAPINQPKKTERPHSLDDEGISPSMKEVKSQKNFNVEFKKTEIFPENSKIVEPYVQNFMDYMKIEHKFEIWSGYKYSILIPEDFRNFLW